MTPRWLLSLVGVLGSTVLAQAQDLRDLRLVRNRPSPYASLVQIRAGLLGAVPEQEDESVGLEEDLALDGHFYWRDDRIGDRTRMQLYGGKDGAYLGLADSEIIGGQTTSRLELHYRYFPFYREGFYRDENFVPTGRYEGDDYGVMLSFAKSAEQGLTVEGGPFYRRYDFDRNEQTAPTYVIPDDYNAYGARLTLEHNTLKLDRITGRPEGGFILTVALEREQNDSDARFGTAGTWESSLPSGVWRGIGHLEWVVPQSQSTFFEIEADGRMTDEKDRVFNYDAQAPQGHITVDGSVGFRVDMGPLSVKPYVRGQFLRILEEDGVGSDQETFFGAGADASFALGEGIELVAEYSYLENESRVPIGIDKDLHGEHVFFLGGVLRLGASRN